MIRCLPNVFLAWLLSAIVLLTGCDRPIPPQTEVSDRNTLSTSGNRRDKEHQMAFLNRIREADPNGQTIQRAVLNEKNELGLILGRGVEMDKIP
jgi:hypothetical protein